MLEAGQDHFWRRAICSHALCLLAFPRESFEHKCRLAAKYLSPTVCYCLHVLLAAARVLLLCEPFMRIKGGAGGN